MNAQRAAGGRDAVGHIRQAGASLDGSGVEAGAVVADGEAHLAVTGVEVDVGWAGLHEPRNIKARIIKVFRWRDLYM